MSRQNLRGLCEMALKQARGVWPEPALLLSWAYGLEQPPPQRSDYVASLLRSAAGREARDGGYLVELMRMARRLGPPPGRYMISKLREEAADNARRRAGLRQMLERGSSLRREDHAWLEAYLLGRDRAGPHHLFHRRKRPKHPRRRAADPRECEVAAKGKAWALDREGLRRPKQTRRRGYFKATRAVFTGPSFA